MKIIKEQGLFASTYIVANTTCYLSMGDTLKQLHHVPSNLKHAERMHGEKVATPLTK
jgi:hypothetical protein